MKPMTEYRNSLDLFEEVIDIDFYPSGFSTLVANLDFSVDANISKFVDNQFIIDGKDIDKTHAFYRVDISSRAIMDLANYLQAVHNSTKENNSNANNAENDAYICPIDISSDVIKEWAELYGDSIEMNYGKIERALEKYIKENIEYALITPAEASNKKYNVV